MHLGQKQQFPPQTIPPDSSALLSQMSFERLIISHAKAGGMIYIKGEKLSARGHFLLALRNSMNISIEVR